MRKDMYLKVVLTVIAICLVWLCLTGVNLTSIAEAKPQRRQNRHLLMQGLTEQVEKEDQWKKEQNERMNAVAVRIVAIELVKRPDKPYLRSHELTNEIDVRVENWPASIR